MRPTETEVELIQLRGQAEALQQLLEVQERVVRQQSEKLRQSEARFRALSDSAPIGILQVDIHGRCQYANPCAERICRGALPSLVGRIWLDMVLPQDRPAVEQRWQAAVEGLTLPPAELRVRREEEAPGWVSMRATRFHAADQHGLVITLEDITARKEAEAELETLHRSLAASSRKAGMAEVASGVLHNIGNVLNSLNVSISQVDRLVKKSKAATMGKLADMLEAHKADLAQFLTADPQGRMVPEYVAGVARHLATERSSLLAELATITKSVDHIARIVSVQQSYIGGWMVSEKLSLKDLVEDALHLSVHSFERHRITVVREYDDLPVIRTDKHKVLQILLNLVSNARDALRAGSAPNRELRVRLSSRDERIARIEIHDNGTGIRAEDIDRIFTLGFTTKKDGHGLGLHGSAIAAKQLGGSLGVRSEGPQRGAVFTLELPFEPPRTRSRRNIAMQPTSGPRRRILLIDDNQDIHQDYRKILASGADRDTSLDVLEAALFGEADSATNAPDFEIDSALQGEQGYEMLCAALRTGKPYAMAFVDMRMPPGWDGVETVARLWQDYPELEVVICTAYSDTSWEEIARRLGRTDRLLILKKPFDHMEVQQLAWALTERWRLREQARDKLREVEAILADLGRRCAAAADPAAPGAREAPSMQELVARARSLLESLPVHRSDG